MGGSAGFRSLSSFLRQNSTLLELIMWGETIDVDMASSFSEALSSHPTLESLRLMNECGLDNDTVLERILGGCGRVKGLGLKGNKINSAGAAAIAGFIGRNETQTEIMSLCDNRISDADVPH